MASPEGCDVTAADLDRHRIGALEKDATEQAALVRSLEREVDRLKIEQAGVMGSVARLEGKLDERDKTMTASLARLHERLDERLREVAPIAAVEALSKTLTKAREAELRDEGAKAMRRLMWQQWFRITGAAAAVGGVIVAALALILH
jgi:hypothetical protein